MSKFKVEIIDKTLDCVLLRYKLKNLGKNKFPEVYNRDIPNSYFTLGDYLFGWNGYYGVMDVCRRDGYCIIELKEESIDALEFLLSVITEAEREGYIKIVRGEEQ